MPALVFAWASPGAGSAALGAALAGLAVGIVAALAGRSWGAAAGAGIGAGVAIGLVMAGIATSEDANPAPGAAFGLLSMAVLAPVYVAAGVAAVAIARRLHGVSGGPASRS